jgi:hypothetical protein
MNEEKSDTPTSVRAMRRDDAAGDRLADAERVADSEHQIAHLQPARVGELQRRQALALGVDAQHGKVRLRILHHQLRREFAAVVQRHAEFLTLLDDVEIGDDHAIRAHDHARAERVVDLLAARLGVVAAQERPHRIAGVRAVRAVMLTLE